MKISLFGKEIFNATRFGEPAKTGDNGKPKRFTSEINQYQTLYRTRQDIKTWRDSLTAAESYINPSRWQYYRLLKDIVLDAHLSAVVMQRKNTLLCKEYYLYNMDGTINEEKSKLISREWFKKILSFALDAKYYGFSLVDLGEYKNNDFPNMMLIPREYVKPELGIVVKNSAETQGVKIDDPAFYKWNLYFCPDAYDLGIFMKAAPLVLWKKNAMAFWSEHTEKFAQPMRVGKTDTNDNTQLKNMENAMRNMGSSFWAVLDKEDDFQLVTTNTSNANEIYENLINVINSELSKLIVGQTGTTDEKSFTGSANVHAGVLNDIITSDERYLCDVVNGYVLKVLSMQGFDFTDVEFKFNFKKELSLEEKAKTDASFMPYVKFEKEYLEETYGIKLEESDESDSEEVESEKKSVTNLNDITNRFKCESVSELYNTSCTICGGTDIVNEYEGMSSEDEEKFIQQIFTGEITMRLLPAWLYEKTAKTLFDNVLSGMGYSSYEIALGGSDALLVQELRTNIYAFSAAKTYQNTKDAIEKLQQMSEALATEPVSFTAFEKEAKKIFQAYNRNYLKTEYVTSKLQARSAVQWRQIQDQKYTLKYLEYNTVGDDRVRPEHKALDGIIRPVDDNFWNNYMPPNGWRCRCDVLQHDDVPGITSLKGFKQPQDVPDLFLMNAGKDGYVFSPEHPYFEVAPKDKAFALSNFGLSMPQ
jgi:SPP1 gp7 family putative phage head morphogenesis protein